MDISQLTKTLAEYNAQANAITNLVATSVSPIAYILCAVFFSFELDDFTTKMAQEGAEVNPRMLLRRFSKYILALFLISQGRLVFDTIMSVVIILVKMIDKVVPVVDYEVSIDLTGAKGITKQVLVMIAGIVEFLSKLSIKLIALLRSLNLYALRGLSPLLAAFFMSEHTRQITIGFLKLIAATTFQAILVIIFLRLYPVLVTSGLTKVELSSGLAWLSVPLSSLAQGIIFIMALWGTEKKAKQLLNAM